MLIFQKQGIGCFSYKPPLVDYLAGNREIENMHIQILIIYEFLHFNEEVILRGISSRGHLLMNPLCYGIWRIHHFTQEAQCVHKGASGINKPHHLGFFLSGVCKLRIKLPKGIFLRVPIQTNCPECEYDALIISRDSQYCFMIHIVNLQLNHAFYSPLIYRFGFSYNLRPHPSK